MGVVDKLGKIFVSDCTYLGGNEIKYFLVSFFYQDKKHSDFGGDDLKCPYGKLHIF